MSLEILGNNLGNKSFESPQKLRKIPANGLSASGLISSFGSICCEEFRRGQKLQSFHFESAASAIPPLRHGRLIQANCGYLQVQNVLDFESRCLRRYAREFSTVGCKAAISAGISMMALPLIMSPRLG